MEDHTAKTVYNEAKDDFKTSWDKQRVANYIHMPHMLDQIGDVTRKNVIDVGCGYGVTMKEVLAKKPALLAGVDISDVQIEVAKKHLDNKDVILVVGDLRDPDLSVGAHKFDIVYSTFCLSHMANLDEVKAYFRNIVKFADTNADVIIYVGDGPTIVNEGFDAILFPRKSELLDVEWFEGAKYSVALGEDFIVYDYYWKYETIKSVMEEFGIVDVKKIGPYLKDEILKGFTEEEWKKLEGSMSQYIIRGKKV